MGSPKLRVEIRSSRDIVVARQQARELAQSMGFEGGEISIIAAAISEIAGNILDYAPSGEISLERIQQGKRQGLGITATDGGAFVPKITSAGLNMANRPGSPGARWLMDDFEIEPRNGKGTVVRMAKWLR